MSKSRTRITESEWLRELERIAKEPVNGQGAGLTTREISKALGVCQETAVRRLQHLIDQGLWGCAGRKVITTMDGRVTCVPIYRPVGRGGQDG